MVVGIRSRNVSCFVRYADIQCLSMDIGCNHCSGQEGSRNYSRDNKKVDYLWHRNHLSKIGTSFKISKG